MPLQDQRDVVPVDPDSRLPRAVLESLGAIDPSVDGWGSEVLSNAVGTVLHEFEAGLESGDLTGLELHATEAFSSSAMLVAGTPMGAGPFSVQRLVLAQEDDRQAVGLLELLGGWRASVARESVEAHFKIIGVERDGQRALTTLRLELVGRGAAMTQVTAQLDATWDVSNEGAPRLSELELGDGTLASSETGPLFVDVTAAALAGPALDQQLSHGLEHWRDRLDTRHGVGTLGHHGVALGDVNGDGLDDIYLCQPGGLPNLLYLRDADGTTREVAHEAGIDVLDSSQSALLIDVDGDGARDLVLAVSDQVAIFRNDGRGVFRGAARFEAPGATSMAAADVDRDGDLDIFVCGYVSPYDGTGAPEPYHDAHNGQRNLLLLNQGQLRFSDGTDAAGLLGTRFSFAAAFEDVDDDGDQDLYVANDFGRNHLYLNAGDGTFADVAAAWGVEDLSAGMAVSFADVNGDGRMDLHVANMFSSAGNRVAYQRSFQPDAAGDVRADFQRHARGNSLFLGREGGFDDVSVEVGITMGRWAWGALFTDFENDGLPDLYVPNGFVTGARKDDL